MISKIQIKGFKSIREQDVQLRDINILIGGNGVGKSNFISVFSLIKNIYEKSFQNYVISKGGADTFLHFSRKKTKKIEIEIDFVNNSQKNKFIVSLALSTTDALFIESVKTAYLYNQRWRYTDYEDNTWESNFKNTRSGQAFYVNDRIAEIDVYHFHDTGNNSPMRSPANINDNYKLRRDGSNLASFLYLLQENHEKHFKRIESVIKSIAPFFKQFALSPSKLGNGELIRLQWIETDNEEIYFDAHHLSDGTLRFIALTTLLLQPNPPKTIIIDEPELGLHPVAINKLAGLIQKASKRSQIIISSQSVNLVDNFSPEDIIVADRMNDETVFKHLDIDNLNTWLEDYSLGEVWEKKIIGGQPT